MAGICLILLGILVNLTIITLTVIDIDRRI